MDTHSSPSGFASSLWGILVGSLLGLILATSALAYRQVYEDALAEHAEGVEVLVEPYRTHGGVIVGQPAASGSPYACQPLVQLPGQPVAQVVYTAAPTAGYPASGSTAPAYGMPYTGSASYYSSQQPSPAVNVCADADQATDPSTLQGVYYFGFLTSVANSESGELRYTLSLDHQENDLLHPNHVIAKRVVLAEVVAHEGLEIEPFAQQFVALRGELEQSDDPTERPRLTVCEVCQIPATDKPVSRPLVGLSLEFNGRLLLIDSLGASSEEIEIPADSVLQETSEGGEGEVLNPQPAVEATPPASYR